jgi:dihydroflavonol-4-reductase
MADKVLVTGATGYIAGHAIERLLAQGHIVVGTVRDPGDTAKTAHLRAMPGASERLTLVAADLNRPGAFDAHMDVDVVMHMASPYALTVKDPQADLVDPAVNGTLAALTAAKTSARVRRIVLTSSMAAVTDEPDGRVLTEADWNSRSSLTRNAYYFSKTQAERAAWDFMAREKLGFDLVVMNPFLVIGPSHTRTINTSAQTFADMANGKTPAIMALTWGVVDVRDVAEAHLRAAFTPTAQGRHLLVAGHLTMAEAATVLRDMGFGARVPRRDLSGGFGTALMKLASYTQGAGVGSYLRTHLGRVPRFDTSKAERDLGMVWTTPDLALRDTITDLARWGHIRA